MHCNALPHAESNTWCQMLELKCLRLLDDLAAMKLPSMRKFEASHARCRATYEGA
jgi:hypothetical protein